MQMRGRARRELDAVEAHDFFAAVDVEDLCQFDLGVGRARRSRAPRASIPDPKSGRACLGLDVQSAMGIGAMAFFDTLYEPRVGERRITFGGEANAVERRGEGEGSALLSRSSIPEA